MKIYIIFDNLLKLSKQFVLLEPYYIESYIVYEIFSKEGMYIIDSKNTFKLNNTDNRVIHFKNYYKNISLEVDYSYINKIKVYQIPNDHIQISYKYFVFKLSSNSKIKLIIQTVCDTENIVNILPLNSIIPSDIYFESNEDIDLNNHLIKEEINVFLSHLN
uniref:Uncharacterized protein n=1 Tax=viral metagenome TaxID=1070528 RepID=A0A6C0ES30_9ZZZZ